MMQGQYDDFYLRTVPFNYNFIFTRVDTRGNTRYFACV